MAFGHSSCRLSGKCQPSEAHSHALTSIKTLVQLVQEGAPGVVRVPLEGGYEVLEGQCPPLPGLRLLQRWRPHPPAPGCCAWNRRAASMSARSPQ